MPKAPPKKPATKFQILEEATVPLPELTDDPDNLNLHDEENLAAITASLEAFGQPERLIVRKKTGVVYAGNGRLECMRRLGWDDARIQYVEGTADQCRAYAIASNRTPRMSRFDEPRLLDALKEIRDADLSGLLAATGFNADDVADMERHLEEDTQRLKATMPRGEGGTLAKCPNCKTTFRVGGSDE